MSVVIGLDISEYRIYLFIIDNYTRNETQPTRNHIKPNIRKVEKKIKILVWVEGTFGDQL